MEAIISIRHLNKRYGSKPVLNDINLEVHPGQVIGYIGPNGAGKSTTVKILCGIIQEYEGDVVIAGRNLRDNMAELKRMIGYIPELPEMYDLLTPREYLTFIGKLYHLEDDVVMERSRRLLDSFGLADKMDERMDTFSKGMRQKVLITSGLLHNPSIVILDEPMSGLDANAVILVKELMQVMKQEGKTIIYCSHMMDVVEKVSDRIILINEGRVVADGTITQLRQGGDESLEQIFAKLTVGAGGENKAEGFTAAFNQ